jgi:hypothetical protein
MEPAPGFLKMGCNNFVKLKQYPAEIINCLFKGSHKSSWLSFRFFFQSMPLATLKSSGKVQSVRGFFGQGLRSGKVLKWLVVT